MSVSRKPLLIVVVGPTAIGKTALAIKLAQAFNTEIISADSRQFYKEMEIGTAVPSSEELAAAPHHFIQHKSITEAYTVGDFETEALAVLEEFFKEHSVAVMVGGSGLYVDAVVKGLDSFPKVPETIRRSVRSAYENGGLLSLQEELKAKDPLYFEKMDAQNPRRVMRAVEIIRATGRPFSDFHSETEAERFFDSQFIGLTADRELIYERINKRVDIMIENGLVEEAKKLHPQKELNALQTVGYRELFDYFEDKIDKEEAIRLIKRNTRRFAKRQGTWFRKNEAIDWFEHDTDASTIIQHIKAKNALN
ncbi:tRNA (adenosine(37)-N6)-dimethylallyltransferase MiaA [Luteirhabdus pelagi]|uniref:tRNA (adenosine(37)-N6)-dimethylallyltransferase MiaA n=1 Tax=Luteirhabdus pelagi TaxID=2792783 RepID=UPI00193AD657|nr:tRNA (adenosine(37)-N6)-dimethylallyltransferase MiaA [Luteirhabdus pelagi]